MSSTIEASQVMVDAWFDALKARESICLVTATHAEAQLVNEAIQARRVENGSLRTDRTAAGQGGQTLLEGDLVQTRRNDSRTGVENRQTWTVMRITDDAVLLASASDSTEVHRIGHEYARQHLHLGYATTVYGAQGETTDRSLVGPGVDAAGLYVGLTRGRKDNKVVLTTPTAGGAKNELADMLRRVNVEATMDASRAAAAAELNRAASSAGPAATVPGSSWLVGTHF